MSPGGPTNPIWTLVTNHRPAFYERGFDQNLSLGRKVQREELLFEFLVAFDL